jgi:hypothetical protein
MAWIKFTSNYDWRGKTWTKSFKAGQIMFATRKLSQEAVNAGAAILTTKPDEQSDNKQQAS